MFTKIQARIVAFFSRPGVQSAIRHLVVTAAAAAFAAVVAGGGLSVVGTSAGAALVLRAVWVAVLPLVKADVESVVADPQPVVPQTEAGAKAAE